MGSDWVHDRFEDDRYDRMHKRPPVDDRYEPTGRAAEVYATLNWSTNFTLT